MSDIPHPETLTRQPGAMGRVATEPAIEAVSAEDAVAEAIAAKEAAEQASARDRQAAESASRERDEARNAAHVANAGALSAREQSIETAIASHNSVAAQARAAMVAAQASGDSEALADAVDRLTDAKAALRDLGNQKQYYAEQKTRQPTPEQRQQPSGDRVRTPGGELTVTAQAKQWMDGHSRFYSDPAYYNHAVAAHSTITADGIQEGSPAYFRALDDRMTQFEEFEAYQRGDRNTNQRTEHQPVTHPNRTQPRASSMGAPVSRATQPARTNGGQPDPLTIARRLGGNITVDDLREAARFAGFGTDETGFQKYLAAQEEVYQLERAGQPTGLVTDTVYR